jgi:hypothetical protein
MFKIPQSYLLLRNKDFSLKLEMTRGEDYCDDII